MIKRRTIRMLVCCCLVVAAGCAWFEPDEDSDKEIAVPVFTPPPGTYDNEKRVIITCPTQGAEIHYTTDGTDPTASDPTISSGESAEVLCTTMIKTVAIMDGRDPSDIAGGLYEIEFEWVRVQGGSFQMGDTFGGGDPDENPVHSVTVSSFVMSKTEVTQKLYQTIMGTNPSKYKWWSYPVEGVDYSEAVAFCNALSEAEDLTLCYSILGEDVICNFSANGYRLPTEAEWEYAAKGGCLSLGYMYSGSDDADAVAWHSGNSASSTNQVARKLQNELGLFDMSGNVWEWCWDWYGAYEIGPQVNPAGPESGTVRVIRGGSWWFSPWNQRCAVRYYFVNDLLFWGNLGFRIVRAL